MSWEPINLASPTYAVDPEPPHPDFHGLLYVGKRHVVSAPTESLKTLTMQALLLNAIRAGRVVACVDLEMGPHATRRLLTDLGATADELAAVYYVQPNGPPTAADLDAIIEQRVELVMIDASAGAYDVSGLDDNTRKDAERFARQWITPLWLAGVATVVIDHVTKNAEGRGKYAIGSERKVGGVDVHLGLEAVSQLTRGGIGLVRVRVHKDRPGFLHRPHAAEIALTSDRITHAITLKIRPTAVTETPGHWQPTVLMGRVSEYLQAQTEPVSLAVVEGAVRGKSRDWIRKAVQALVEGDYVTETRGARNARMLTSAHPFTTSPHLTPTSPGGVTTTSPDLAPPPQGGEVRGEVGEEPGELTSPSELHDQLELDRLQLLAEEMGLA